MAILWLSQRGPVPWQNAIKDSIYKNLFPGLHQKYTSPVFIPGFYDWPLIWTKFVSVDLLLKLTVKCRRRKPSFAIRVCPGGSLHSSLKNVIPRHSTVQRHWKLNKAAPLLSRWGESGQRKNWNGAGQEWTFIRNRLQPKSTVETRIPPKTY